MATLTATSVANIPPVGSAGNVSVQFGSYTFAAAAIADKVRLCVIPAGAKVFNIAAINAALGASSTVALGWEYVDGSAGGSSTAFLAATSTAAAGRAESTAAPVSFDKDVYLIGTVGGAAATGQYDVSVSYEFVGLK